MSAVGGQHEPATPRPNARVSHGLPFDLSGYSQLFGLARGPPYPMPPFPSSRTSLSGPIHRSAPAWCSLRSPMICYVVKRLPLHHSSIPAGQVTSYARSAMGSTSTPLSLSRPNPPNIWLSGEAPPLAAASSAPMMLGSWLLVLRITGQHASLGIRQATCEQQGDVDGPPDEEAAKRNKLEHPSR